jgi:nitrogen fixation NifU-like protein
MASQGFDFWQDHSVRFLEMAFRMDRRGRIDSPDGYGKRTGVCGDTVEFFLVVDRGVIKSVMFDTDGCVDTNACANTAAIMAEGKTIENAWDIAPEDIIAYLETIQEEHYHCAELAAGALYLALQNCRETMRDPWKKAYRKRLAC